MSIIIIYIYICKSIRMYIKIAYIIQKITFIENFFLNQFFGKLVVTFFFY